MYNFNQNLNVQEPYNVEMLLIDMMVRETLYALFEWAKSKSVF